MFSCEGSIPADCRTDRAIPVSVFPAKLIPSSGVRLPQSSFTASVYEVTPAPPEVIRVPSMSKR